VTIYQVGLEGDVPFQAIQLLTGESLQDRLNRGAPLPVGLACLILRHVAEGLAAAHEKGLIHRDIKPANIWLESTRPGGPFRRARILDFGLARAERGDTQLTSTGTVVGTPHFMAPEQASGLVVDARADLFSLGCVAYSILTGEIAFDGSSTMAVLMALATRTPPRVDEKNPAVPVELADLIAAMLAKEPEGRPASAGAICTALDAILAALPSSDLDDDTTSGLREGPGVVSRHSRVTSTIAKGATATVPAPASTPRNRRWKWLAIGGGMAAIAGIVLLVMSLSTGSDKGTTGPDRDPGATETGGEPITVGILHSLSGNMATSESPVVDATVLAIEEINAAGGLLGRKLIPVVVDGASDPGKFEQGAERLISENKAAVIFGCWTSASRKAVRPVVERNDVLLFYPVQYEGLEQSPRVVYLGPTANQQLNPAVDFLVNRQGRKRLFLVGSDYVFPRAAHEIVKDQAKAKLGAEIVGEKFLPLGAKETSDVIVEIKAAKPDAILNTINGATNFFFLRQLNADPATADIPVLSLSLMENDLRRLDPKGIAGDYLAGTYFESVASESGNAFMKKFRRRYGEERRYSDPIAAAYSGVHLWAKAVATCRRLDATAVSAALRGSEFNGPSATIRIDRETLHSWLPVRIGRIEADGSVKPVVGSGEPVRPEPFPSTRSRAEWDRFLSELYLRWDGHWQAPGVK
ncbi:MAG TPA: transporter substrate-binding protein, partial [Gemmata sp.]|nr:transporter substrate-binding protein [Gemmata sp.]